LFIMALQRKGLLSLSRTHRKLIPTTAECFYQPSCAVSVLKFNNMLV